MPRSTRAALGAFTRFASIVSDDREEVCESVGKILGAHRLEIIGQSQALATEVRFRRCHSLVYGCLRYGATVEIDPGKLNTFYLIQIPTAGHETVHCGDQSVSSSTAVGTIISPALRFHMRHERDARKLFIRVDRAALERKCVQYYGHPLDRPLNFAPEIPLHTKETASLVGLLAWQLREASEGILFDEPLLAAQYEEALMLALLTTLHHNHQRDAVVERRISPAFIRHAEAFMAQHADLPLTIGRIAEHVGVSARSLFVGYQQYRGMTPMRALKMIRLDRVHAELCECPTDATVTDIALRWGFRHLGLFSAAYRERFGELPSALLRARKRHRDPIADGRLLLP